MADDAQILVNQLIKQALLTEVQAQEIFDELGTRTPDTEAVLKACERKGWLTPLQTNKIRKGEMAGMTLGSYRLLYKIASGSFGRVYRAENIHTGQVVAIKVLRQRWSEDDHIIELFNREGRLGLSLRHPNIVEVLEVDRDKVTKQYYIVMEFVEGGNLRELLKIRGKLKPAEALRIIEEAVEGMAHAYARGITHRDMKLTNVLITSQGGVKLVDFGLANIFTRKGLELEGGMEKVDRTVDYAGLERASGVKPGDVRSDIYFLGCILYELLSGRSPLEMSRDPSRRGSAERFIKVKPMKREDVDAPPSTFQLVERMMSLDPKIRFQTPSQLLEAVKAARRDIENPQQASQSPSLRPVAVRTIFVVESDERLQNAMRDKFKEMGFRVLLAANPTRALERFEQQKYEAIVIDAGTTGEEGRFAYEKILRDAERDNWPMVGLLILSEDQAAWAEDVEAFLGGEVLKRPVTLKQVHKKLEELLNLVATANNTPRII